MTLYKEVIGNGPDVVLLHGWGLHGGIFEATAAHLAGAFRVTCPDLPGHGRSPLQPRFTSLDELADAVASTLPEACTLVGWSLGGLAAMRLAAAGHPSVRRLVLVATTPRFVRGPDWEHGLEPAVVDDFATGLREDFRQLVQRFLMLQARGDDQQRALIRQLRARVFAHGEPVPAALEAGLGVLAGTDLRDSLGRIDLPTLVIAGTHDRLTPPAATEYLAAAIHGARRHLITGASHAPFLSHPDAFHAGLDDFLSPPTLRTASA